MTFMPRRREAMFGGTEVTDFETLDPYVTLVLNRKYADSVLRE